MSADDLVFVAAVGLLVLMTLAALCLGVKAGQAHDDWARTQKKLAEARRREIDLRAQLADSRMREHAAVNLLADLQNLQRPFPDVTAAAGSLGDQVEAWLATNPTSEQ